METIIRQALTDDYKEINRLTIDLGYSVTEAETGKWLGLFLESEAHAVFVAVEKSICGWIALEKRVTLETGFRVEISGLIVGSAFRKEGKGSLLMDAAEKWTKEMGVKKIVVSSDISREGSHRFYKEKGFLLKKTSHKYEKKI